MTVRAEPDRWRVIKALAPPFALVIVAMGGAKLNRISESASQLDLDPRGVILGGLLEVTLGLLMFFRPTRFPAAVACSVWLAGVSGYHTMNGPEGPEFIAALLALGCISIGLYEWRHWRSTMFRFPQPLALPPSGAGRVIPFLVSLVGVSFLVRWAIGGTAFWLSIPLLAYGDLAQRGKLQDRTEALRTLLTYLLVVGIGVSSWWGFVGHYFMSDSVAASVGWDSGSPFQLELAFYHLGFGIVGLMCLWFRDDFWVAVIIPVCVFAFGAASVHIVGYVRHGNTAPGNWGFVMFFGDVFIPATLLILLWLYRRRVALEGSPVPSQRLA
jgi:hypothetical protein